MVCCGKSVAVFWLFSFGSSDSSIFISELVEVSWGNFVVADWGISISDSGMTVSSVVVINISDASVTPSESTGVVESTCWINISDFSVLVWGIWPGSCSEGLIDELCIFVVSSMFCWASVVWTESVVIDWVDVV